VISYSFHYQQSEPSVSCTTYAVHVCISWISHDALW